MGRIVRWLWRSFFWVFFFGCALHDPYQASMFEGRQRPERRRLRPGAAGFPEGGASYVPTPGRTRSRRRRATRPGDLAAAQRSIEEAAKLDGKSYSYLRILGYRALILLAQGQSKGGARRPPPVSRGLRQRVSRS